MKRLKGLCVIEGFWLEEKTRGREKEMGRDRITCIMCLLWVRNFFYDSELLRTIHVPDTVLSTEKKDVKEVVSSLRSPMFTEGTPLEGSNYCERTHSPTGVYIKVQMLLLQVLGQVALMLSWGGRP